MNTTASPLVVLGPVDQFPAEGYENESAKRSSLDTYATALAGSEIAFDLSEEGARLARTTLDGELLQAFLLDDGNAEAPITPGEEAWKIDFEAMLGGRVGFDDLSDAAEPEDFVRRFVEMAGKALDQDPELAFEGRHFPIVRWHQREDDEAGARVQLLGILRATDKQFQDFCASAGEGIDLIHEESEIEGRGIREVAMSLAVFGISLAAAPEAEAGLFDKLFEKHRDAKAERQAERKAAQKAQAVVQHKQRTGWVDAHQDAKIDRSLLERASEGGVQRRVVVDITKQRAYLLIDGEIAIDTAVSTARSGKFTPRGEFTITERIRSGKRSTIYGCEMPCWMRLDSSAYGLHVGDLPGRPASAGCVRLPYTVAPVLFDNVTSGTTVKIVEAWNPEESAPASTLLAQVD